MDNPPVYAVRLRRRRRIPPLRKGVYLLPNLLTSAGLFSGFYSIICTPNSTCGALRLARFNVQIASVEKRYFVGLPIPAAAGVIAATVLLYLWLGGEGETGKHIMMLLVIFGVAGLMVSEIRYYSFKEIRFHHRHPFPVLLGLIVLIYLTVGTAQVMLFHGIGSYALSGPLVALARRLTGRPLPPAAGAESPPVRAVVLDKPGQGR